MKKIRRAIGVLAVASVFVFQSAVFSKPPELINYQGRLVQGTNLYTGAINLELRLYNAPAGGTLLYNDATLEAVIDGLYSTYIGDHTASGSLRSALTNEQVWLEVVINGVPMSPRERLVSVPYARMVEGLLVGTNRNVTINPGLNPLNPGGFLNLASGGGAIVGGGFENRASGYASVVSGGEGSLASNTYATVAGGGGNVARGWGSTVGGGQANNAYSTLSTISGGLLNQTHGEEAVVAGGRFNEARGIRSSIGGGENNVTTGRYSVVGGGMTNRVLGLGSTVSGGISNTILAAYSTIGGGTQNIVSNEFATIGGGSDNQAGGDVATISGGTFNRARSTWSTVAGGAINQANGLGSSMGGGFGNIASGNYAAVPGGYQNTASSANSMAAGNRAKAIHAGTFVWADSTAADFSSTATNQFLIRAGGGVGINTVSPLAPLHVFGSDPVGQFSGQFMISGTTASGVSNSGAGLRLAGNDGNGPREWGFIRALKSNSTVGNTLSYMSFGTRVNGGALAERMRLDSTELRVNGTFVSSSDREKKQDIVPVNPQEVLSQVVATPVHYWRYKDNPDTLHVGPMAQDFYASFGVGPDERHIASVDADGIAFAAIQALAGHVSALEAENARLREELDMIKQKLGM